MGFSVIHREESPGNAGDLAHLEVGNIRDSIGGNFTSILLGEL